MKNLWLGKWTSIPSQKLSGPTHKHSVSRLANILFQNNRIFSILVPKPLFIHFRFFFFQKNLKSYAFPIVCEKDVILQNFTA